MKLPLYTLTFLFGELSLLLFRHLPGEFWLWSILFLFLASAYFRQWLVTCLLLGHLWAAYDAHNYFSSVLPLELNRSDFELVGEVVSFPKSNGATIRFEFDSKVNIQQNWHGGRIRLGWRDPEMIPNLGETWKFRVRLFVPSGMLNTGGFDYERWLFSNDIVATGYVRGDASLRKTTKGVIEKLRTRFKSHVLKLSGTWQGDESTLLLALLIGDRSGLSNDLRDTFQATGTSHLIAISGLHIGLVAGACWVLFSWSWSRSCFLMRKIPAPVIGAVGAIIGALIYAALAGFSVPTQRALIMTAVFASATIFRLHYLPIDRLAIALILILLFDPRAVWQEGFWFSFIAVLLLILLYQYHPKLRGIRLLVVAQLLLSLIMLPLQSVAGLPVSLVSPLVNWVAVPWFSFVLVPITLLAAMISLLQIDALLGFALQLARWTIYTLTMVSDAVPAMTVSGRPLFLSVIAVIVILIMTTMERKRVAILALFLYSLSWLRIPAQNPYLRVTAFDVGQGQAILVETQRHLMLFDLGPGFDGGFNTAAAVILPYLHHRGIASIDMLVLSHDDRDHTGGAGDFLDNFPVHDVRLSQAVVSTWQHFPKRCQKGEEWQWDGIHFRFLHPSDRRIGLPDNDMSCVIMISAPETTILLTGDITHKSERKLLSSESLLADLVFVPHHGSNTSSSEAFVEQLSATYAVVSAGKGNRYGHPTVAVMQKWQKTGAIIYNTANTGMLSFQWYHGDSHPTIDAYRIQSGKFWNR